MPSTTRTREVIDRMRAAMEAEGADPHLLDDLPTPVMLSDLHEVAREAGLLVSDFFGL